MNFPKGEKNSVGSDVNREGIVGSRNEVRVNFFAPERGKPEELLPPGSRSRANFLAFYAFPRGQGKL